MSGTDDEYGVPRNQILVGAAVLVFFVLGSFGGLALIRAGKDAAHCDPPKTISDLDNAEAAFDTFMTHAVMRNNVPPGSVQDRLAVAQDVVSDRIDLDHMQQFPTRYDVATVQSYSELDAPVHTTKTRITLALTLNAPDVQRSYEAQIARQCEGDEWKVDQWKQVGGPSAQGGANAGPPSPR